VDDLQYLHLIYIPPGQPVRERTGELMAAFATLLRRSVASIRRLGSL
jgi:hypothetical protein